MENMEKDMQTQIHSGVGLIKVSKKSRSLSSGNL